ncbi:hypothetical protein Scep_018639 [Stephania cephalantha]|uniref:Protein CPR-5 n=1 Tax=Stephania cephalantha TaxID=152367 RepID=A0AAP0I9I4_9MAGN
MEAPSVSSSQPPETTEEFLSEGEIDLISSTDSISNCLDRCLEVSESNGRDGRCSSSNPKQCVESAKRSKKQKVAKLGSVCSSSSSSPSRQRGLCLLRRRRSPRAVVVGRGGSDLDALGLPLGMSIAAVVAQVLEKKSAADANIPVDHLSSVCSSAVEESLANVFGDRFDCFVRNFEKSFRSTLKTLRLINEASHNKEEDHLNYSSAESYTSEVWQTPTERRQRHPASSSTHSETVQDSSLAREAFSSYEGIKENISSNIVNLELALRETNQPLSRVSSTLCNHGINNSMMTTYERSVVEQVRSNKLKAVEIGLKMHELQLKESHLTLKSDSNDLERYKLKTQLQDMRHGELLKRSIDCFVAGLLIMSASLVYGAYVYSYEQLIQITTSCNASSKESKSWWMPKQVTSFTSVLSMIRCQIQVASRMLFGTFMILAIGYLLLQRPAASHQSMPVTFLLLAIICGFAGKLCVDTLGGSGYCWLLFWESLCLLHFFANVCTSILYGILYGSISVSQKDAAKSRLPFWIRRFMFYATTLLILPMLCGLMPFAGPSDWKNHFFQKTIDSFLGERS